MCELLWVTCSSRSENYSSYIYFSLRFSLGYIFSFILFLQVGWVDQNIHTWSQEFQSCNQDGDWERVMWDAEGGPTWTLRAFCFLPFMLHSFSFAQMVGASEVSLPAWSPFTPGYIGLLFSLESDMKSLDGQVIWSLQIFAEWQPCSHSTCANSIAVSQAGLMLRATELCGQPVWSHNALAQSTIKEALGDLLMKLVFLSLAATANANIQKAKQLWHNPKIVR